MGFFNNAPSAVKAIVAFVLLFVLGLTGWKCAHAAEPYVQLSGGTTYVRGITGVLDLAWTWKSPQSHRDFWKTDLTLFAASSFRGQPAPNNFAVRALYVTGFGHADVGLGLAWLQNPAPYNGSPINFTLEAAYRFQRWPLTLTVSHISNAGSRLPNYGRDFVMLGYRFSP